MFKFVHTTGKTSQKRHRKYWMNPDCGGKKRKGIQNSKYTIYFISRFMPNVNMLIVVKVLECIHASTVERSLPQLRGWGVVVALGTPPCPHWVPARTIPQSPRTLLSTWARHPNTALNWGAQVILKIIPDHPHPTPALAKWPQFPLLRSLFWSTS